MLWCPVSLRLCSLVFQQLCSVSLCPLYHCCCINNRSGPISSPPPGQLKFLQENWLTFLARPNLLLSAPLSVLQWDPSPLSPLSLWSSCEFFLSGHMAGGRRLVAGLLTNSCDIRITNSVLLYWTCQRAASKILVSKARAQNIYVTHFIQVTF